MKARYLFQQDKHYDVSYDTGDKVRQCLDIVDIVDTVDIVSTGGGAIYYAPVGVWQLCGAPERF